MKKSTKTPPVRPVTRQHECAGCCVRQETIEFLRDQLRVAQGHNDQLQNKLLALTGDAADRYQKLRVMELAQAGSSSVSGILPPQPGDSDMDEFDAFTNTLHEGLGKMGGRQ